MAVLRTPSGAAWATPQPCVIHQIGPRAKWDSDAVRDVRQVVVDRLGDPDGVLMVDETGDLLQARIGRPAVSQPRGAYMMTATPAR